MFYQITRLLAGKPGFRIDLNKHAKEIVSELTIAIFYYNLELICSNLWIIGYNRNLKILYL